MAFRVKNTAQADRDLDQILERLLAESAGDAGLRWFAGMKEAIETLAELPGRCPLAQESETFRYEVRQLLYGKKPHIYRILFTIKGDLVIVFHIRHGRRDQMH